MGEQLTINLAIENAADLGGYELRLTFGSSVVHVQEAQDGGFLGSTGLSVLPVGPHIDNNTGAVAFGAVTMGSGQGPSGTGVLGTVSLEAVGAGKSPLHLDDVTILDRAGDSQSAAVQHGSVTATSGAQ